MRHANVRPQHSGGGGLGAVVRRHKLLLGVLLLGAVVTAANVGAYYRFVSHRSPPEVHEPGRHIQPDVDANADTHAAVQQKHALMHRPDAGSEVKGPATGGKADSIGAQRRDPHRHHQKGHHQAAEPIAAVEGGDNKHQQEQLAVQQAPHQHKHEHQIKPTHHHQHHHSANSTAAAPTDAPPRHHRHRQDDAGGSDHKKKQQQQQGGGGHAVAALPQGQAAEGVPTARQHHRHHGKAQAAEPHAKPHEGQHHIDNKDSANANRDAGPAHKDQHRKGDKAHHKGGKAHGVPHHAQDAVEGLVETADAVAPTNLPANNNNNNNNNGGEVGGGGAVVGIPPTNTSSSGTGVEVPAGAANNTLRRTFGGPGSLSYDAAVARYITMLSEKLGEELEQSSNRFRDFDEPAGHGVLLPTGSAEDLSGRFGLVGDAARPATVAAAAAGDGSYCDPTNADYTAASDAACVAYLSDMRNVQGIKVMSSILSTGRTIKFKLYYRHNDVEAVIKVSQKKFVLEPASEVMAFTTDRLLQLQRVPPVAWIPLPLDFFRAAAAQVGAFYAQWFEGFVLNYDASKVMVSKCYASGGGGDSSGDSSGGSNTPRHSGQCLNVSVQLWLFDVHNADETSVAPPHHYRQALNLPAPADGDVLTRLTSDASYRTAVAELVDEFAFDYIIGNSDRWFGHNSFALGACARCEYDPAKTKRTVSTPRLAFIDQGSSFYGRSGPEMNPFTKDPGPLCRFRQSTALAITNLLPPDATSPPVGSKHGENALYKAIRQRLPKGIFNLSSHSLLRAAGARAEKLAAHIRSCLGNFTRSDVLYF